MNNNEMKLMTPDGILLINGYYVVFYEMPIYEIIKQSVFIEDSNEIDVAKFQKEYPETFKYLQNHLDRLEGEEVDTLEWVDYEP